jgi:hypothetical protein
MAVIKQRRLSGENKEIGKSGTSFWIIRLRKRIVQGLKSISSLASIVSLAVSLLEVHSHGKKETYRPQHP